MKILVTGAIGFVGTNLCKRLLLEGNYVHGIDNFHSGTTNNLKLLSNFDFFSFTEHDINYSLNINEHFDQIYHLACPASPKFYQLDPIYTSKTSFIGTLNVIEKALIDDATLLFTSTSETYGDPLEHPQKESYNGNVKTTGPRACYDEGKRMAESILFDFHRIHSLEVRIARLFNTYGPFMRHDDGRVISNFINQSIKNIPLTIYGDGSHTRSFCYIDDLIDGLIKLMNSDCIGPINLGNPDEFSLLELSEVIKKNFNKDLTVIFADLPEDDPKIRCPDISKAKLELDWEPKIPLLEGLSKTYNYFQSLTENNQIS